MCIKTARAMVALLLGATITTLSAQTVTHGPAVGAVSSDSAAFVLRTDVAADVAIELSTDPGFSTTITTNSANTGLDSDNWGKVSITGLAANTKYYYRPVVNGTPVVDGIDRHFFTFPPPGTVSTFKFLTGSCQQAGGDPFSNIGDIFPIMATEEPAFLLHQGDWGYPDTTDEEKGMPGNYFPLDFANVQATYRARYTPDYPMIDLLRVTPVDFVWDDHDMVDNNSDGTYPGIRNSVRGYDRYFPHYALPDTSRGVYHKFSYGNADFFAVDNRAQRDPNLNGFDIFGPDSVVFNPKPGHSILGPDQMSWLKSELSASTADWKFISTGTPFNPGIRLGLELAVLLQGVLPGVPTPQGFLTPTEVAVEFSDKWAGFPEDIIELITHVVENNIQNVIFLSGDIHTSGLDDGTNSIFPELTAGPLDRINGQVVALLEQFGLFIFNKGGHTSNQADFGDAYGRVSVFGSDSVRLEVVSKTGNVLGKHTVASGYLPETTAGVIGPLGIPFDTVLVGTQNLQGFLAVNTSIDTFRVTDIQVIGDQNFVVVPPGFILPTNVLPGDEAVFGVLYIPTSVGADTAIIQVTTNAPRNPVFNILATGYGTTQVAIDDASRVVRGFYLEQNYPNPFNPSTTIAYYLPQTSDVTLEIYDVTGRRVKALSEQKKAPGKHTVVWDGKNDIGIPVSSGIYFYKIKAGLFTATRKMTLLR